jgi:thioredoxin reductase
MAFRVMPPELSALPEPLALHSARIGDVRRYAGRDVCVIGAGQSALETAAILREHDARVHVLARCARIEWNPPSKPRSLLARLREPDAAVSSGWKSVAVSELPRVFRWCFPPAKRHWFVSRAYGPSGAWWLRERVENRAEVLMGSRVVSAQAKPGGEGVVLRVENPGATREMPTDHVVAGTGFRVNIDRIEYLDPSLASSIAREGDGIPALDSHFETSVPGLFMVGLVSAPVFGPIMRFMYGAKHVAPVLARELG